MTSLNEKLPKVNILKALSVLMKKTDDDQLTPQLVHNITNTFNRKSKRVTKTGKPSTL